MINYKMEKIKNKIEEILKSKKISYDIDSDDNPYADANTVYFIHFANGIMPAIHIETDEDFPSKDEEYFIHFYVPICEPDYEANYYIEEDIFKLEDIEEQIDNLIQAANEYNKILKKIKKKINEIIAICEENGIDYEDIITVNKEGLVD